MGKAVKALSVLLIVASLFGLAGGSLSLKDSLNSKEYWENASGGGGSIGQLEDGLNQLKEHEQAYLDGRDALAEGKAAYDEGVKAFNEGKDQYEDGVQTLKEKQAEYDAGVQQLEEARQKLLAAKAKLEAGQKQYDEGVKSLNQAKALQDALTQLASGYATWQQGYQALLAFQASAKAQGVELPDPSASNVSTYDSAIAQMKSDIQTALGYCDRLETLKSTKAQLENALAGKPSKDELTQSKAALEAAIAAAGEGEDTSAYEAQLKEVENGLAAWENLEKVNDGIAQIEAGLGGQDRTSLNNTLNQLNQLTGVPQAVADGQKTLASGTSQVINAALGNETMAAALTSKSGMSADQLKATAGALGSMDYATFNSTMGTFVTLGNGLSAELTKTISEGEKTLSEAAKQLDAGYAQYRSGLAQYNEGKAKLEEGAKLLEEGQQTLEDAAKQLEEGKEKLTEAEKQIADGEAQLAEFEYGRKQVIDGLKSAIDTEAYEGLESIKDRLGPDFSYMKNETDLDIDKGLEVVAAAKDYASDATGAVTEEITKKAIGSIVAIAGAAVAMIAGLLGLFLSKPAFSGVVALLGGGIAVAGALVSAGAGSFFSQMAGAGGPGLLTAAGITTAAAAVPQAISAFLAGKKA